MVRRGDVPILSVVLQCSSVLHASTSPSNVAHVIQSLRRSSLLILSLHRSLQPRGLAFHTSSVVIWSNWYVVFVRLLRFAPRSYRFALFVFGAGPFAHRIAPQSLCDPRPRLSSKRLLTNVSSGKIAAIEAVRTAGDIVADYGDHGDQVSEIASLAARGKQPSHAHRDLVRFADRLGALDLQITNVRVQYKKDGDHGFTQANHPVIYPHELFAEMYLQDRAIFDYVFVGPGGLPDIAAYWNHQPQAWVADHPGLTGRQRQDCIALGIHADKGSHINRDQILTISWGNVIPLLRRLCGASCCSQFCPTSRLVPPLRRSCMPCWCGPFNTSLWAGTPSAITLACLGQQVRGERVWLGSPLQVDCHKPVCIVE
jgi:hypothetical protein